MGTLNLTLCRLTLQERLELSFQLHLLCFLVSGMTAAKVVTVAAVTVRVRVAVSTRPDSLPRFIQFKKQGA